MGKKSRWSLTLKHIKKEFSGSKHVDFRALEQRQLESLISRSGEMNMKERAKIVGLGIGRDIENKLNSELAKLQGEFRHIHLVQSGMAWQAVIVYIPEVSPAKPMEARSNV